MNNIAPFILVGSPAWKGGYKGMGTNFDKCTIVPWFSASFGELHIMDTIDTCVHIYNKIPCLDIDIRTARAEWR